MVPHQALLKWEGFFIDHDISAQRWAAGLRRPHNPSTAQSSLVCCSLLLINGSFDLRIKAFYFLWWWNIRGTDIAFTIIIHDWKILALTYVTPAILLKKIPRLRHVTSSAFDSKCNRLGSRNAIEVFINQASKVTSAPIAMENLTYSATLELKFATN